MILLVLAGFKGLTPLFFIQDEGPTMLRQVILGSAAVLFAFSFLIFMITYQKNKEVFLYWYSLALGLNSICFIAVFIQNSVGSPVGWAGRISQYIGGIYFLIAIRSAVRSAGTRKTSFDDVITSSLRIAEEKLRESEERYRLIFETANEGIWVTDGERRTILVNKRMADMLGYTTDELQGRIPAEFLYEGQEHIALKARHELTGGASTQYEFRFRRKDGSDVWVISSATPARDSEGRLLKTISMLTDITGRKLAEEQVEKAYSRLKTFFDVRIGGIGIVIALADGSVLQANDYYLDILGYTRQEFEAGKVKWIESTPPEWLKADERALAQLRDRGACDPYEKEYVRRDGTRVPVLITDVMMPGPEKDILAIVVNMTERKRAEDTLRRSEERFRSVVNNMAEGLMLFDSRGNVFYQNPASLQIHGYTEQVDDQLQYDELPIIWQGWDEQGIPLDFADWPISRVTRHETVRNQVLRAKRSDTGKEFYARYNGSVILDEDGKQALGFITINDITELKHAEEALLKAREELEERVEERTAELIKRTEQLRVLMLELTNAENLERKRLAIILHDHLQQILVGAKLGNEAIQRQILDNELKKSVKKVADLLDESIRVSRTLTTELSPPILHDGGLVPGLEWLARWFEEKQSFHVSIIADTDIPPDSGGISILLFQAIRELLFNAVKHAKVNEALVEVSKTDGDLHITVEDKGAGFNVQEIKNSGPDAGFGLFSIRERIDILGGRINIDSAPGAGTRITMIVPLPSGPQEEKTAVNGDAALIAEDIAGAKVFTEGRRIRVLVADDHAIVREGFTQLIRNEADMEVAAEASNGEEALDMARKYRPDVIIMDISMPKMNGIEATEQIAKEIPGIHIIGLSMYERSDQETAILEAGAMAFLTKDGPSKDLIAAIRDCRNPGSQT